MNYTQIENMLMTLEIEQIERVLNEYKKKYPQDRRFSSVCYQVIGKKKEQRKMHDIAKLIQEIKASSDRN